MDRAFLLSQHRAELQRRYALAGQLNLPLGVVTVTFSGGVALANSFVVRNTTAFAGVFGLMLVIALVAAMIAVFCLIRSHYWYDYKHLPSASELRAEYDDHRDWAAQCIAHENELLQWYQNFDPGCFRSTAVHAEPELEFEHSLRDKLVECIDQNSENNNVKAFYLHKAFGAIILQLVFLALALLLHLINLGVSDA